MISLLEMDNCKAAPTPITAAIDSATPRLNSHQRRWFMTAVGCIGWLVNTGRPDVAYAHSRVSQHMADPTQSALAAVKRICRYLKGAAHYVLSAPLHGVSGWQFYCDSDFAGNAEVQNCRRAQNGYLAIETLAPVLWASKVSSVAFAHPDIDEAHADISSGAAETYCAANATFNFLHLSYG